MTCPGQRYYIVSGTPPYCHATIARIVPHLPVSDSAERRQLVTATSSAIGSPAKPTTLPADRRADQDSDQRWPPAHRDAAPDRAAACRYTRRHAPDRPQRV